MKQIKHILSFFLLLILQLSHSSSFAGISFNEVLCVGKIEFSEKYEIGFLESGFRENYIFEHSLLEVASYRSVSCCGVYTDLVEAWEAVSKHTNIRKHIPSLEKVSDLLNDADFIGKLPNGKADLDAIIDAVKNPLDGGTASKLVKLSDHLENVKQVVKKHSGADGFDRLMTDLKNPAFAMQDGATHMLNDVKNFPEGSIKKFDYEFDGDGVACTKCRFDVELTSGTPKLIEYKSWSLENIPNISGNQLTEYFRSINNLNEMKYIFNKLKTPNLGAIKTQMKSVLSNKADDIFDAMSPTLKGNLGIDDIDDLIDLIDNPNSNLYNFIDIK